jgi:hypothetical protein
MRPSYPSQGRMKNQTPGDTYDTKTLQIKDLVPNSQKR